MTGILTRARERQRRVPVDAGEDAVAVDVGVDDRRDARALEALGELDGVELGRLGPALDRDLAAARVDADRDPAGELSRRFLHQRRIAHRDRAEDDARQCRVSSQLSTCASVRMPPPSCTGNFTAARIASTAAPLTLSPAKAPLRSTTWRYSKPCVLEALRLRRGIVVEDRRLRPCRRASAGRTGRP